MILVIGENITDIFVYCSSKRLSPEACCPVLIPDNKVLNSGGAGNVVENLKSLRNKGIIGIHQKKEITKTRYIVGNQHVMRYDENDKCENLKIKELEESLSKRGLRLSRFKAVVISSYSKGFVTPKLIKDIRKRYDGLIFIDTKDKKGDWCELVDFIKINDKEWFENFNSKYEGSANIFVTKGSEGVDWINKNENFKVDPIEVADFVGAGDSFFSGFITKYLESKDVKKGLDFANKCARVSVSKRGVVSVKKEEIAED